MTQLRPHRPFFDPLRLQLRHFHASYVFDEYGRGLVKTEIVGYGSDVAQATGYRYDEAGRRIAIINPRGYTTQLTLNSMGWATTTTDPKGNTTAAEYDLAGQVTAERDKLGFWYKHYYNLRGWHYKTVNPKGDEVVTSYDSVGNVIGITNELGFSTGVEYDELNRVSAETDAALNRVEYVYWRDGRLKEVEDARGEVTRINYNWSERRIITIESLFGLMRQTVEHIDETGNIWKAQNDLGHVIFENTLHPDNDWVTRTVDALGHGLSFNHDKDGRVIKTTDDLGAETIYARDALGRVRAVTDGNGNTTRTIHDQHNQVVVSINGLGHAWQNVYDQVDNPTFAIDSMNGRTRMTYNANGDRRSLTDPANNTTVWVPNWRGLPIRETDPRGKHTGFDYDEAGRLTERTDRNGRQIEYKYFNNDWLKQEIWHAAGPNPPIVNTISWAYNPNGQMTLAGDDNGSYAFDYDALGRVATQLDVHGITLTYDYTPQAGNHHTHVTDTKSGVRDYFFDEADRLTSFQFSGAGQTPLRFDLTWNDRNDVSEVKRYADLTTNNKIGSTNYQFDLGGRVNGIVHRTSAGAAIDDFAYNHDAANQVSEEISTLRPTREFDYDRNGQLTEEEIAGQGTAAYDWDANGNPTNSGWVIEVGNLLDRNNFWDYSYDDEGNLVRKDHPTTEEYWVYAYDHHNRLITAERFLAEGVGASLQVSFDHDALGNRITRRIDPDGSGGLGVITEHYAFENGNAWADLNPSGTVVNRRMYLDALDSLFARVSQSGAVGWYLTDNLGSVRDMTDGTGALKVHLDYDSWGNLTAENGPDTNFDDRYKYTSREWDTDISWYHYRSRQYDPQARRFTTQDQLGFNAGDTNLNRYVGNGPTNATDPTGEEPVTIIVVGTIIAAAGIGAMLGGAAMMDHAASYNNTSVEQWRGDPSLQTARDAWGIAGRWTANGGQLAAITGISMVAGPVGGRLIGAAGGNLATAAGMTGRSVTAVRWASATFGGGVVDKVGIDAVTWASGADPDVFARYQTDPLWTALEFGAAFLGSGLDALDYVRTLGRRVAELQAARQRIAGQIQEVARRRSLGTDPASGLYRAMEEEAALRLEQQLGRRLRRDPSGTGDWLDAAGRTFDAVGPVPAGRFQLASFTRQIDKHLLKQGLNHVVVDITGLTAASRVAVMDHISRLTSAQKARIIVQPK